jgi:hypothetical protein
LKQPCLFSSRVFESDAHPVWGLFYTADISVLSAQRLTLSSESIRVLLRILERARNTVVTVKTRGDYS